MLAASHAAERCAAHRCGRDAAAGARRLRISSSTSSSTTSSSKAGPLCQQQHVRRRCRLAASLQQPSVAESAPPREQQLDVLGAVFTPLEVQRLVDACPEVLQLRQLKEWTQFLEGLGIPKGGQWKTLRYASRHLAASDPYTAGAAIRWLKKLGPWSDADIRDRLLPLYPEVLAASEGQLQGLVDRLAACGLAGEVAQQLLWECPGLLAAFRDEELPLIERVVASRRNKYTDGATYAD